MKAPLRWRPTDDALREQHAMMLFMVLMAASVQAQNGAAEPTRQRTKLERISLQLDTFEVEIEQGDDMIWTGVVRVNRATPAGFTLDVDNATAPLCAIVGETARNSYQLKFGVMRWGGNATDPDTYQFRASIEHTDLAPNCRSKVRSTAVAEKRVVRMRRGQTFEMNDGDFHVTIRRR